MSELSNERRIPFTQEDEQRIASAATWGMIVSITSIASGGLSLLVQAPIILDNPGLRGLIAAPVLVAVYTLVVNVWLLQASLSFRKVALTDEADQVYLLEGFRKLRAIRRRQLKEYMQRVTTAGFGGRFEDGRSALPKMLAEMT